MVHSVRSVRLKSGEEVLWASAGGKKSWAGPVWGEVEQAGTLGTPAARWMLPHLQAEASSSLGMG